MSNLKYYSTNLKADKVNFQDALLRGLAPDGGLYMPENIPVFQKEEIASFSNMEYHEIAFEVLHKFFKDAIPAEELAKMTKSAYDFDIPLEKVYNKNYIMRLDQGPTASFKDFAAKMIGQLMQYFLRKENKKVLILTATSGDTGSAMANAFYGLDNVDICILYPTSEVSERQRKQMTTLHKNITVLSLDGKFDDCQALLKVAFNDPDLKHLNLSSANSINIGRLIPQAVYYFYAYSRLCDINKNEEIVFSVPSGNFGDLMGGLTAKNMGLPVKKFIIATNSNDEVPVYFASGNYKTIVPSKNSISSAMNVGHPSNMARIVALYSGVMHPNGEIVETPDLEAMKTDMFALSVDDETTRSTIVSVWNDHKVLLEPHGAVGWKGLQSYLDTVSDDSDSHVCVCLETAHPAKFPEEIKQLLNFDPELPKSLSNLDGEELITEQKNDYEAFKIFLNKKYKK